MNNYLSHLLTRSWNQAETVQPRPLSLFEPLPTVGKTAVSNPQMMLEETAVTETPTISKHAAQPTQPRPSLPPWQPAPSAAEPMTETPTLPKTTMPTQPAPLPVATAVPIPPAQPLKPQPTFAAPPLVAEPLAELPIISRVATPSQPVPVLEVTAVPTPPALPLKSQPPLAAPLPQEIVQQPAMPPIVQQHHPTTDSPLLGMPSAPPATKPMATKQQEVLIETRREVVREVVKEWPLATKQAKAVSPKRMALSAPIQPHAPISDNPHQSIPLDKPIAMIQPQIRPFTPPQTVILPEPTRPDSTPTPTINVTIGRIEVRATPPPTSPRRPERPQTPPMGLDDYLRQRNGGQP